MAKSPNDGDQSLNPHLYTSPRDGFDSPERRAQLAGADVVIAVDPDQETRTVLYGREMLEQIIRSGDRREAAVVTFNLDTATEELDELEWLVREIKGNSSFRPADLLPEVVIDTDSFAFDPELLEAVRLAVEKIVAQHRTLLPPVHLRFHYSVAAVGFTTAKEELRRAAEEAKNPVGYVDPLLAFGNLLQSQLPPELIKPTRCVDIVHGVGVRGNKLGVRCRSLLVRTTARGPAYHSRRMPRTRFGTDKREWLVAFSEHAVERICERTVYDWRTFGGQGDAFAFLDNCVYFEDCTDARGEPSFVVYNACAQNFHSWGYVEHVLGTPSWPPPDSSREFAREISGSKFYYRVGYCPVRLDGDIAVATTLLFPGMSLRKGTLEGKLIESSGLPPTEIDRLKARVENQLSMKALADSGDFSLVKWFHDNGVPQVVRLDREVFKYG